MQRHGLRLSLCAMAFGLCTSALAQPDDENEEVEMSIKQPKRQRAVADNKYPMMTVSGTVSTRHGCISFVAQATGRYSAPYAGQRTIYSHDGC